MQAGGDAYEEGDQPQEEEGLEGKEEKPDLGLILAALSRVERRWEVS